VFIHAGRDTGPYEEYTLLKMDNRVRLAVETGGVNTSIDSTSTLSTGTWYHAVGAWDGSVMRLYINGTQEQSTNKSGTITPYNDQSDIGFSTGVPTTQTWDGKLDEIRVSNVARDACWVGTGYNNQSSPGTTVTTGGEQVDPSTYSHHQPITIANGMTPGSCTSDLANFPVLIDTTNWAATYKDPLKSFPTGHVRSTNGYDIIFRDTAISSSTTKSKYDGATGTWSHELRPNARL
jgi:hypothetical protein